MNQINIPGSYLTADLTPSDFAGIFSSHPILFWSLLIIFIILCIVYGIYILLKKK